MLKCDAKIAEMRKFAKIVTRPIYPVRRYRKEKLSRYISCMDIVSSLEIKLTLGLVHRKDRVCGSKIYQCIAASKIVGEQEISIVKWPTTKSTAEAEAPMGTL